MACFGSNRPCFGDAGALKSPLHCHRTRCWYSCSHHSVLLVPRVSNKHSSLAWFLTKIVFFGCCGWIPLGALLPFPLLLSASVALWKSAWFPQQRGRHCQGCPRRAVRQAGRPRAPGLTAAAQTLLCRLCEEEKPFIFFCSSPSNRFTVKVWRLDRGRGLVAWRLPGLSGPFSFPVTRGALTYTQNLQRDVCGESSTSVFLAYI